MSKPERHEPPGLAAVLDIGGSVGALLVRLDTPPAAGELHIRPAGHPGGRFHTGVHHRHGADGGRWIALFPEVEAGTYEILGETGDAVALVAVPGGAVAELDLDAPLDAGVPPP